MNRPEIRKPKGLGAALYRHSIVLSDTMTPRRRGFARQPDRVVGRRPEFRRPDRGEAIWRLGPTENRREERNTDAKASSFGRVGSFPHSCILPVTWNSANIFPGELLG